MPEISAADLAAMQTPNPYGLGLRASGLGFVDGLEFRVWVSA